MSLINKNFIYKEKSETATKFKEDNLKSIISFTLDSWYYHRGVAVEKMHKIRTSFKTLASKRAATFHKSLSWDLKKYHSNNKLLWKVMSSSYHMEQETFIKWSFTKNVYTLETGGFAAATLKGLWVA